MKIEFTQDQLDVLTNAGVTQDDLRATVSAYRKQGRSDEEIQGALYKYVDTVNKGKHINSPIEVEEYAKRTVPVSQKLMRDRVKDKPRLNKYFSDLGFLEGYPEDMSWTEKQEKLAKAQSEYADIPDIDKADWATRNILAPIAVGGDKFFNGITLGAWGEGMEYLDDDYRATMGELLSTGYDVPAIIGDIGSWVVPIGAPAKGVKVVNAGGKIVQGAIKKGGANLAAKAPKAAGVIEKGANALGWTGKMATNAVGTQALFTIQQTAEGLFETGEWNKGMEALNNFGADATTNAFIDIGLQSLGGAWNRIKNLTSKTQKAIETAGGAKNLAIAQERSLEVLNSTGSREDAAAAFYASITENLDKDSAARFKSLMESDEEFAKIMQRQAAGAKQIVIDAASELTKDEYAKASQTVLKNLWGEEKNVLGKNEIDFTKNGIKQLLGLDNAGFVMEKRAEALGRASNKAKFNPSIGKEVKTNFDALTENLRKTGSQDLERAYKSVEPGTLKSFDSSKEYTDAFISAQTRIEDMEQALGRQLEAGEVERIMNEEMRKGAERHFRNVMANGTDDVIDINDIKNHFDKTFVKEVAEGQAETVGAFTQGINTQILDVLDPVLYQSNQAMRFGKELEKIHDFGKKYTNANYNELESILSGVSPEERATKLAIFKMGMLDRATEAVVNGNTAALDEMRTMMTKGKLKSYFSAEEVGSYIDAIRPKAEAARTLNNLLGMAYSIRGESADLLAPAIRAGVSATVMHAPNVFMNSLVTLASRVNPYGPGTAKMLQTLAENPDWKNFNKLVAATKDPVERQMLNRQIITALQDTINQSKTRVDEGDL